MQMANLSKSSTDAEKKAVCVFFSACSSVVDFSGSSHWRIVGSPPGNVPVAVFSKKFDFLFGTTFVSASNYNCDLRLH